MGEIELSVVDASSDGAQWAMRLYFAELGRRFPGGFDPGDACESAASSYNPPQGLFLVARRGEDVVGCGAVQYLDAVTAEIKRMWIAPGSRGRGLGRRLLARLEDEARQAGRSQVVLDTNGTLTEALALYSSSGYAPVDRYNDNPYAQHWFLKSLD